MDLLVRTVGRSCTSTECRIVTPVQAPARKYQHENMGGISSSHRLQSWLKASWRWIPRPITQKFPLSRHDRKDQLAFMGFKADMLMIPAIRCTRRKAWKEP